MWCYYLLSEKFFSFCHPIWNVSSNRRRVEMRTCKACRRERGWRRWLWVTSDSFAPRAPWPLVPLSIHLSSRVSQCFLFLIWNVWRTCQFHMTPIKPKERWSILKWIACLVTFIAPIPLSLMQNLREKNSGPHEYLPYRRLIVFACTISLHLDIEAINFQGNETHLSDFPASSFILGTKKKNLSNWTRYSCKPIYVSRIRD